MRRLVVLLVLLLPLTVFSAVPANASATESEFVSRANSARSSNGLRTYAVRSDLVAVARRQAARMASARRIYHNPNLTSEVRGWRSIGENVGSGGTVARIHQAFMNSSGHRDNILSGTFTEIGVGTARGGDGQIYVSQVFRRPTGTVTYTPPPAPRRTTAPTPVRRASRGAVRRPPAKPAPAKPAVVVNPVPGRLKAAWLLYRRERPVSSMDRVLTYVRAANLLAG